MANGEFKHSTTNYGENLYMDCGKSSDDISAVRNAVIAWANEVRLFCEDKMGILCTEAIKSCPNFLTMSLLL